MNKEKKSIAFDRIVTIVLLLVVIALAIVLAISYLHPQENGQGDRAIPNAVNQNASESDSINVEVAVVTPSLFEQTTTVGAEIVNSGDSYDVTASIGGTITEILVEKNQKINEGDIIAYVDPSTPGSSYKAQPVVSQISGTVTSLPIYLGATVSSNSTVVTVQTDGVLELEAKLPEKYLSTVTEGLEGSFITSAWPDDPIKATVKSISDDVDSSNRTFTVTLSFEQDGRFKNGMYVALTLVTNQIEDAIVVPSSAVDTYVGDDIVYTVKDGKAERVVVTQGLTEKGNVVITSGLNSGDTVITKGNVTQGATVNILN